MRPQFELARSFRRLPALGLALTSLFSCGDEDGAGARPSGGGAGEAGSSSPGSGGDAGDGNAGSVARGGTSGAAGRGGTAGRGGSGGAAGDGAGEGGSAGEPEPAPFSMVVEPASLSLPRGASAWLTVRVERDSGFAGPVSITLSDLPDGFVVDTLVLPAGVDSGVLPLASSDDLAVGSVLALEATGSSGSHRARAELELRVAAAEPSSQEKIRAALAADDLDYETSLLYRAYALFEDARLPAAFVGSGSEEEDNLLFDELFRGMSGLSTTAQANLRPFLARPADPESAWNGPAAALLGADSPVAAPPGPAPPDCVEDQSGLWISRRGSDPVRVWARCPGDATGNAETVRLVEKTLGVLRKIYGSMTDLMTHPIPDQEGGDDAIDFYLLDPGGSVVRRGEHFRPGGLGTTQSDFPIEGAGASAFVMFPRSLLYTSRFHATVIHEFFHVLQKAYNHESLIQPFNASNVFHAHWFIEASAAWASAHFDRTLAPWEDGRAAYLDAHQRFPRIFQKSTVALNSPVPPPQPYGAYIWPYFVEQETASPSFMPQIWEGLMSAASFEAADAAVDAAFSFRDHFEDFALRNLNSAYLPGDPLPQNERYVALDPIFPDGTAPQIAERVLTVDQELSEALDLPNLSTRYFNLVADPTARKVELDLSELEPAEAVAVQALAYTRDGWVPQPLDFSDDRIVKFCFDQGPTTVERRGSFLALLLVISNRALGSEDEVRGDLVVNPSSDPCAPVWSGSISMTYRRTVSNGVVTASSVTPVAFEYDPTAPQAPYSAVYRLRSGNYSYEWLGDYTGRDPTCRTRESASGLMVPGMIGSAAPGASFGSLQINTFLSPATYSGNGFTVGQGTLTSNCNDNNNETTQDYSPTFTWWATGFDHEVSEDGLTLEGEYTLPDIGDGAFVYRWQLARVDE